MSQIYEKDNRPTCPCKRLPLSLSSLTGAELGNVHSLRRHRDDIVKKRDSAGNTPLHLAAQHGHVAATALLLDAGCDVNAHYECGATPLHRASFAGAVATMQLLLQRADCDLFIPDTSFGDGMTALHKAASGGRYLAVQLLLTVHAQRGSLRKALQAKDSQNQTPLQVSRSKIKQQDIERKSVARWDAVAGGTADWSLCAQILQRAEQDGTVLEKGQLDNLPKGPLQTNEECEDCEAGQCATKSWELAFQRGLMQAIVRDQSLTNEPILERENFPKEIVPDDAAISAPREQMQDSDISGGIKTNNDESLGRKCDICLGRSLFLYPVSGKLICRGCKKAKKSLAQV